MPLDPTVQAFLKQAATLGGKPTEEATVEENRAVLREMRALAGAPEEVGSVEDRAIPGPAGRIPVRIYRPNEPGRRPLLVFFHGGGWVLGDLDTIDNPVRALTNRSGCIVVSVDYRLAPEYPFPAAPDDCYAATNWVAKNAESIGGDSTRIAVAGDSAGANLAAVSALMARDRKTPDLAFQLLIYPVTDFNFDTSSYRENADNFGLTRAGMIWFWNHYLRTLEDGTNPYASPLRAAELSGLPSALVITAEYDPLRDEGESYASRLREAGVPVISRRYDGMIHGFFQMGGIFEGGRQVIEDAGDALRSALQG